MERGYFNQGQDRGHGRANSDRQSASLGHSGEKGWSRPSQDWNKEGSHRYNTGGSYEDYQERNRESRGQYAGRGPKGFQRTDDRIREEVCERLTRDPNVDATEIEIEVKDGEVTLTGTVFERRQKRVAEDAAYQAFGVRDVHNRIRVSQSAESHSSGVS